MVYATADDLRKRIGERSFAEIYPAGENAGEDISAAQAEIDGNLSCRYEVPVTDGGALPLLKDWTLTLAEEKASARPAGSQFTEKVKLRVEQVRKYLERIRLGTFLVPGAKETEKNIFSIHKAETPLMTRDGLEGF